MKMQTPSYWEGKKISKATFSNMQSYGDICEVIGKFVRWENMVTFSHYKFERQWLIDNSIYVEDAAPLSEDGYHAIMSVLEKNDKLDYYYEAA